MNVRNTYTLQMSEKINKTKQAVAGNTMRRHSAKGFFSFPGERERERERKSKVRTRENYQHGKDESSEGLVYVEGAGGW